jgi:hypothetical protein
LELGTWILDLGTWNLELGPDSYRDELFYHTNNQKGGLGEMGNLGNMGNMGHCFKPGCIFIPM